MSVSGVSPRSYRDIWGCRVADAHAERRYERCPTAFSEEFSLGWSGRGRVEYGFGADLNQSFTGVASQIRTMNSLGDAGGTLDLVGKAVPAAEIHSLQQNGLSSGIVTRSRECIGVSDALDDLPLRRGRGAGGSVIGQTERPRVISYIEHSAQLDLPPDERIEQSAVGPMDICQPLVRGADLCE